MSRPNLHVVKGRIARPPGGRARLRSSLPPSTSNQRRANGARDSRAEPGGQEEVRPLVLLRSSPTTHPPPPHSQDKPIGWLGTPPTAGSTTRACERTRRCFSSASTPTLAVRVSPPGRGNHCRASQPAAGSSA